MAILVSRYMFLRSRNLTVPLDLWPWPFKVMTFVNSYFGPYLCYYLAKHCQSRNSMMLFILNSDLDLSRLWPLVGSVYSPIYEEEHMFCLAIVVTLSLHTLRTPLLPLFVKPSTTITASAFLSLSYTQRTHFFSRTCTCIWDLLLFLSTHAATYSMAASLVEGFTSRQWMILYNSPLAYSVCCCSWVLVRRAWSGLIEAGSGKYFSTTFT